MHLFYHNQDCQQFYAHLVNYPVEVVTIIDIVVARALERMAAGAARTDDI
jgi:hypothetical protein